MNAKQHQPDRLYDFLQKSQAVPKQKETDISPSPLRYDQYTLPAIRCIHPSRSAVRYRTGITHCKPRHISGTIDHRSRTTDHRSGITDRGGNNRTNVTEQTNAVCYYRRATGGTPSGAVATYPARNSGTKFTRTGGNRSTGLRYCDCLLGTSNICRRESDEQCNGGTQTKQFLSHRNLLKNGVDI